MCILCSICFIKILSNVLSLVHHIRKYILFVASALDMSFKILDSKLVVLQSIPSNQRVILSLAYDHKEGHLYTAGTILQWL